MKAVKVIGVIVLVLVIGVAGLLWYGYSNIDNILHTAVERFGSDVTDTKVSLQDTSVDLQGGRVQFNDLVIANPTGYTTDYAFALGTIAVQVVPHTVGTGPNDVVVIDEITIDGASIIAELKGLRESNLQQLYDNIQDSLPAAEEPPAAEPEPPTVYTGPNFRVRQFQFSNADIALVSEQFGERTLNMPTVSASDVGGESGLPPRELTAALMRQVLEQAIAAVRDEVEEAAEAEVRSRVEEEVRERLGPQEQERLQNLGDFLNR
jgi:hypothetical protein